MCLDQSVADQDAVFVLDEDFLLGENHPPDAIGGAGHTLAVKLAYVLVAVWIVYATLVAVQPQVEWGAVLDDRLVERRQQHMGVVVSVTQGHNQQSVLFAGVAVNNRRAMISPRLVSPEHLLG